MSSTGRPTSNQSDILEVIANLSNNEVFTPPRMANAALDLLPEHVWADPSLRWLDPASKTGVFPREVTRRLMKGLRDAIPHETERLRHILSSMVYAVAITETTAMMTRRSLYCSKMANSDVAAVKLGQPDGNVWFHRTEHDYDARGRCVVCNGSKSQLEQPGRDNYAYAFVHQSGRAELEKEMEMKFDVIVGNPPYQMDSDGSNRTMPIYDVFISEAKKLNPRYITFIVPSRWIAGGLGLGEFRKEMLNDDRLRALVDFPNAEDVFPGVGKSIKGGVMFFLWDRDNRGPCEVTLRRGRDVVGPTTRTLNQHDVFVRDARALSVLNKVLAAGQPSLSEVMSARTAFGLTSNFDGYRHKKQAGDVRFYATSARGRIEAWVSRKAATTNEPAIDTWKAMVPKAGSDGGQKLPDVVLGQPLLGVNPSICTQSFLFVPTDTEQAAASVCSYYRTRFVRFLVSLRKVTQDTTRDSYLWVPQQQWDRVWTDNELYTMYGITEGEQAYIASMVKEMPE